MSAATTFLWHEGRLDARDDCDVVPATMHVADSWLVTQGSALALDLHRSRFVDAASAVTPGLALADFWDAAVAAIPRAGDWFPRVELREQLGAPQLLFRLREAPRRHRSVVLATHEGRDPRTTPLVKGPDLEAMVRLRTEAQERGADEAVLLDGTGHVAEGSTSALVWWRRDALCLPDPELARVDSVTARSLVAVALALGVDVIPEWRTPAELDGHEVWAVNALHGIRIATRWIAGASGADGPGLAAEPGRLDLWRARLDALRRPLPEPAATPVPA